MYYPKDPDRPNVIEFNPRQGETAEQTKAFLLTDSERVAIEAWTKAILFLGDEDLAGHVLQVGMDWEHLIAVTPNDPAEIHPADLQKIEEFGRETLRLANEIEKRLFEKGLPKHTDPMQHVKPGGAPPVGGY